MAALKARGEVRTAIGLMSGTSMDGVDAAIIETDGITVKAFGATAFVPYSPGFRSAFRDLERPDPENAPHYAHLVDELTATHADAVEAVLDAGRVQRRCIDVVGFHGQTVYHAPEAGVTIQLGNARGLADRVTLPVVADFRSADVRAGGQGAPLAPLYHQALAAGLEKPLAVLNVGGVANVTWLGPDDDILAFDTGPGNAMIDDWISRHTGQAFDADGRLAATGHVDRRVLAALLDHPYFEADAPKSLDRRSFDGILTGDLVRDLALEVGAATLSAFTVEAVVRSRRHMPSRPLRWLVCGGGCHNIGMMEALTHALGVPVDRVDSCGWDADFLEAQAFAYLAVRAVDGLPLSLPTTTGVGKPLTGGHLFVPTGAG